MRDLLWLSIRGEVTAMRTMPAHRIPLLTFAAMLCACPAAPAVTGPTADPATTEPAPAPELPALTIEFLREHTRALSDDALGGRLPGSDGARAAVLSIVEDMQALGLEPAGENGSWTQTVRMRGVTVDQATTTLELAGGKGPAIAMPFGESWVGSSFAAGSEHLLDAELVFLGYGVKAPEQQWDDYAKLDVKGKIVVVFVGDPPVEDGRFAGKAMTYYGRWGYKYEAALAAGAAGCLVIHEDEPASYGWNVPKTSFSSERFTVLAADGQSAPALAMQGWISAQTADAIAKRGGKSLAKWHELALRPDFKPIVTNLRARGKITTSERVVEDVNVLGRLPGAKQPEQAVILTAHWDHLGTDAKLEAAGEDGIHNGAIDNASGIATMLGVAAELRRGQPLDRSVVLLATTAEEQGLLGSRYWVANPTVPHADVVAVINLDSMNVYGRTKQVEVVGWGQTTLEDILIELAAEQGRSVVGDSHPEAGSFYRSDHFPFAQVGIPALYFHSGLDMIDGGLEAGEQLRAGIKQRYHTPADEFDESWSFEGALEDAQLVVGVVQAVAAEGATPSYKPSSEFAGLR
jgi:Zn-dependent M28 family amino/carboxypeptidase